MKTISATKFLIAKTKVYVACLTILVTPLSVVALADDVVQSGIAESAENIHPLTIGATVPSVSLHNMAGEIVDLRSAVLVQPTVLIFYRGGWCPYCNAHLGELAKVENDLVELGYQVLALSPDRPEKLKRTAEKQKIKYRLLSDSKMNAAKAFGLAFKVGEETVKRYKTDYHIDLEADSGETHHLLPVPAAFVIDSSGQIKLVHADPNYKKRIDLEKLLLAARKAL